MMNSNNPCTWEAETEGFWVSLLSRFHSEFQASLGCIAKSSEMAQQIKELPANPKDLSSFPHNHMVEGVTNSCKKSSDFYTYARDMFLPPHDINTCDWNKTSKQTIATKQWAKCRPEPADFDSLDAQASSFVRSPVGCNPWPALRNIVEASQHILLGTR